MQELEKGEDDIIEVAMRDASLVVNELKVKVDLTKFTERHVFNFDDALDESVGNDEVYRSTVQPLVATIFKNGKATCFAYGQTGSGKTFTMQPLPMRAARDMFALLEDPQFADLSLFVSCFEIYGGKLYDLLNGRKRLDMREDGKKRVCIVDLKARSTVNCAVLYVVYDPPHLVNSGCLLSFCAVVSLTSIDVHMLLSVMPAFFPHYKRLVPMPLLQSIACLSTLLWVVTAFMVTTIAHACWRWLVAQEVEVNDEDIIQQLMEHSNANRSTGSTGANSESSRSHSIMQVSLNHLGIKHLGIKHSSRQWSLQMEKSLCFGNKKSRSALSLLRTPAAGQIALAKHYTQYQTCVYMLVTVIISTDKKVQYVTALSFGSHKAVRCRHACTDSCTSSFPFTASMPACCFAVLPEEAERWRRAREANRQDQLH